ncbi:MAG: hypothetical protein JJT96_19185 [Opitutales bacterium]|nr:hypothetical protein [Opitutales bacterium]
MEKKIVQQSTHPLPHRSTPTTGYTVDQPATRDSCSDHLLQCSEIFYCSFFGWLLGWPNEQEILQTVDVSTVGMPPPYFKGRAEETIDG